MKILEKGGLVVFVIGMFLITGFSGEPKALIFGFVFATVGILAFLLGGD